MSAPPAGPLPITAELLSYYSALVAAQPALASIRIASHPTVGRHLIFSPPTAGPSSSSSSFLPPFTPLFTEAAAVFASDDPAVCIACHQRHRSSAAPSSCCSERERYRGLAGAINGIGRLAGELGYGETRGLLLVDWLMRVMQDRERRRQRRLQRTREQGSAASLAASFALPPPPAESFSFAVSKQGKTQAAAAAQQQPVIASSASMSPAEAEEAVSPSPGSLASLALSAVFSLDAGPASLSASHTRLASAMAQLLPLPVRRLVSVAELRRLLGILELNAHELVDEAGEKAEALFPFFALIQHSCAENCAFTALTAAASSSPTVRVCSIRAITACSPLSICYAPPYLPTAARQRYLQSRYHFTCSCPLCCGLLPDRCRAFVCRDSQCRSPVWVWGGAEAGEEQPSAAAARLWRCSGQRCTRAVGQQDVRAWREAERSLAAEVERLQAQADDDSEREEKGDSGPEDTERVAAILRLICGNEQQTALDGLEEEEEQEDEADEEAEGAATGDCQDAAQEAKETAAPAGTAACDASASASSLPQSKSQQKNRKRREKQKRAAQAAAAARHGLQPQLLCLLHPSHHHAHWLLQLLIARHSARLHWAKAAHCCRQRVRNVRLAVCSGGTELHWQEALEWGQLASVYASLGDTRRQRRALQHCVRINSAVFGHDAACTLDAQQQLAANSTSTSSGDRQAPGSEQDSKRETERASEHTV